MFAYNILGQYTIAAVLGLICIVLVIVQGLDKIKKTDTYKSTLLFAANIVLIAILLCGMYSREVLLSQYDVIGIGRFFDYGLYALLLYSWTNLAESLIKEQNESYSRLLFIATKSTAAIAFFIFSVIAVFFMNDTYHIESHGVLLIYQITEIVFGILSSVLIGVCAYIYCTKVVISTIRKYVIISAATLGTYYICQGISSALCIGAADVLMWKPDDVAYSGWILTAINASTIFFIYKKDFQEMYQPSEECESPATTIDQAMDKLAVAHHLTHREREIVELVYEGNSNAMIAEILCISQNTVKSHIRNIFEKLDVNSRFALTALINHEMFITKNKANGSDFV